MKIIAGKRQSGKTTQLIYESANTGYPIVCRSVLDARKIFDLAKSLNIEIPHPLAFEQIANNRHVNHILVDDLFLFAQFISKKTIEVATIETPGRDFNQVNFYLKNMPHQPVSPQIGDSWQNSEGETFTFTSAGWENMGVRK